MELLHVYPEHTSQKVPQASTSPLGAFVLCHGKNMPRQACPSSLGSRTRPALSGRPVNMSYSVPGWPDTVITAALDLVLSVVAPEGSSEAGQGDLLFHGGNPQACGQGHS